MFFFSGELFEFVLELELVVVDDDDEEDVEYERFLSRLTEGLRDAGVFLRELERFLGGVGDLFL